MIQKPKPAEGELYAIQDPETGWGWWLVVKRYDEDLFLLVPVSRDRKQWKFPANPVPITAVCGERSTQFAFAGLSVLRDAWWFLPLDDEDVDPCKAVAEDGETKKVRRAIVHLLKPYQGST